MLDQLYVKLTQFDGYELGEFLIRQITWGEDGNINIIVILYNHELIPMVWDGKSFRNSHGNLIAIIK